MDNRPKILVINTGSTSTKIAAYEGEQAIWTHQFEHKLNQLERLKSFDEKISFRTGLIENFLKDKHLSPEDFDLYMCRGGLIRPVSSGVFRVNEKMLSDLKNAKKQHASNLAAVIGSRLGKQKPVYIADPVVVDEMQDMARFSGHKLFNRISIFHALNHKAVARKHAEKNARKYEELNLIVVHMGGGISVGAHQKGKVIDVNQALDGEGPFSPERSGTLPAGDLVRICFSGKYTQAEILKMIVGKGGLVSYLGTQNVKEIEAHLNSESKKVLEAMAYQIAKSIGEMAVVLSGNIDAIVLTGGVAYSKFITEKIEEKVHFLAPVYIYPGEDEMQALAYNAFLVYKGDLKPKEY